mgnify:CR=1 FL=1
MKMKNPPHPGRLVHQECLEPLGLTVTKGAEILGVTRQALNNLVNLRRDLGRDGYSALESVRFKCRSMARNADGL